MDENTKHIVASNLTIAYCANRPSTGQGGGFRPIGQSGDPGPHAPLKEEQILEIYKRFLALLSA